MPTIEVSEHVAGWWEARAFQDRHSGEFFICPQNSKVIMNYVTEHKLPLTVASFEEALEWAKENGKLFAPNAQTLAKSTSAQVALYAHEDGIPRYNDAGKIIGYDWPEEWKAAPAVDLSPQRAESQMSHPEDLKRKPSRSEWALWGSNRCKEYLEATNQWNREIGGDFFRD